LESELLRQLSQLLNGQHRLCSQTADTKFWIFLQKSERLRTG
jgi:hypothetical protein